MTKHPTLFITSRGHRHQEAARSAAPPELEILMRRRPARDEMLALLPQVEFLISERTGELDADIIAAGRHLRLIQRLGSQSHDIDLEAARGHGVPVCYWPVYTCIMVAEHLIMQMLALARRLREAMDVAEQAGDWGKESRRTDEDTFSYNWSGRQDIRGLWQRTVGILGLGEIGSELARRLQPFGCTVLYNKRNRLPEAAERDLDVRFASLDELLAESDFLCLLLPYFPETDHLIDAEFLARLKPGACLVSCGSGSVIDEAALARALESGHLYGAATDTYEWEPIRADNPLLPLARRRANVVLTPHIAAGDLAAHQNERRADYTNLLRALSGEALLHRLV